MEKGSGAKVEGGVTHDQIIKLKDCRKSVTFGINKKRRHFEAKVRNYILQQ